MTLQKRNTTPDKILKYGLIGAGAMGRAHINAIQLAGGAEVVAIADPHSLSLEKATAQLDNPAVYSAARCTCALRYLKRR